MKSHNPILTITLLATAALLARRFTGFDGATCGANAKALGVTEFAVDSGDVGPVHVSGVVLVEAGAAVTAGASVVSTAAGKAIAATAAAVAVTLETDEVGVKLAGTATAVVSGSVLPQAVNGWALDAAAADGDLIRVLLA